MPEEQVTEVERTPWHLCVVATWAIAVWGGVIGTLLLLAKQRYAVPVLLVRWRCTSTPGPC